MIKFIISSFICLIVYLNVDAQGSPAGDTISKTVYLDEVVISANKIEEQKRFVAQQIQSIPARQINLLSLQTTAELLANEGEVAVQQSQQGGGSPVIRGFEASRILLVIDGIRINNLIYRSGHLQNIITIDQNSLKRVEVLFGPSSTVYGSDALGGVINLYTKNPVLAGPEQKFNFKGQAFMRYGTVNNEKTGHVEINLATRHVGSLTSFTFSDFNDLLMGGQPNPYYNSFGERFYFVKRMNGVDSLVQNNNIRLQRYSGYSQYDLLQKILLQPNENFSHCFNFQFSNSSDIPRYDRLTDPKEEGLKYAQWYYGPQYRLLTAYHLAIKNTGFFNAITLTASYQHIKESRHNRSFGKNDLANRNENVKVAGFNLDFVRHARTGSIRFGIDGQYNTLKSTAFLKDVTNGMQSPLDTRYPDGHNRMLLAGAFMTQTWKINDQFVLNDGLRLGYATLFSSFKDKTFFPFPFNEVKQKNFTYSGNLGLLFLPSAYWKISLNGSTGFRVPNVDDLSKVFDSSPGTVIVPNPNLKPEKTVNGDLNITRWYNDCFSWENVFFITYFIDAIVTDTFQFQGQDSVIYDGTMSRVMANQNKEKALLLGCSSNLKADLTSYLGMTISFNYNYGRILEDSTTKPLDHIPPVFGQIGIQYHSGSWSGELFINYNGWKRLKNYYLNGEDNEQYATADGMPAWYTVNSRISYKVNDFVVIQAGIDNIFDIRYRTFASGINAPGRNIFGVLRVNF